MTNQYIPHYFISRKSNPLNWELAPSFNIHQHLGFCVCRIDVLTTEVETAMQVVRTFNFLGMRVGSGLLMGEHITTNLEVVIMGIPGLIALVQQLGALQQLSYLKVVGMSIESRVNPLTDDVNIMGVYRGLDTATPEDTVADMALPTLFSGDAIQAFRPVTVIYRDKEAGNYGWFTACISSGEFISYGLLDHDDFELMYLTPVMDHSQEVLGYHLGEGSHPSDSELMKLNSGTMIDVSAMVPTDIHIRLSTMDPEIVSDAIRGSFDHLELNGRISSDIFMSYMRYGSTEVTNSNN